MNARLDAFRGITLIVLLNSCLVAPMTRANPGPPPGPCCFPGGGCQFLPSWQCDQQGGQWLGVDVPCDPNPCLGACCTEEDACIVTDCWNCVVPGGRFLGPNVSCESDTCSVPVGACCFPGTGCLVLSEANCSQWGGLWVGRHVPCSPSPCYYGACCSGLGTCICMGYWDCVSSLGRFLGAETTCDNDPCALGACCLDDGSCVVAHEDECVARGGTFTHEGYPCSSACESSGAPSHSIGREADLVAVPNPFVERTALTIPDAIPGEVSCQILDVRGRLVRTLRGDGVTRVLRWDGRDDVGRSVPAGAYFVRLPIGKSRLNAIIWRVR